MASYAGKLFCMRGLGSLIISDTHNYKGNDLPYDDTFIEKDTICVNKNNTLF